LLEPEFHVVGIASDGRKLVESAIELQPDVVILGIWLPELNGLEAGERIRAANRRTKIIYSTFVSSLAVAAEAFRRGASGFVLKQGTFEELRMAVRGGLRGESYVSSLLNKEEITMRLRLGAKYASDKSMTRRQIEILQLIVKGYSLKKIAQMLKIKLGTVEFHKYTMMESHGIRTTAALIEYAFKHQIATMRQSTDGIIPMLPSR